MGFTLTSTMLAAMLSAGVTGHIYGWTPGVGNESTTSDFTVDRQSRNDVVSFWHGVYMESEGYADRIQWTGSVAGAAPGSTSSAFKGDVQRRINYYRAMAGLSADMDMTPSSTVLIIGETPAGAIPQASTTKQVAAQAAALMVSRNTSEYLPGGGVSQGDDPHNPSASWTQGWSSELAKQARNGAFYSNLASGLYGPGAIDAYMDENDQGAAGAVNADVAHRRYLLYSRRAEFATGDVTSSSGGSYYSANALYCAGNLRSSVVPQFVAWPSDGYFPEPLATDYWSLSFPGADFSSATVTMTTGGGSVVNTSVVSRTATYGDNTLVWTPDASSMTSADTNDQVYHVTVSNMVLNSVVVSHSYTVTMINPNRLLDSPDLAGSASPPDSGARYYFDPIPNVEEYELDVSRQTVATWLEGAEAGTTGLIVDGTEGGYDLISGIRWNASNFYSTGSKAFRLAFETVPRTDQMMTIQRSVIPRAGAGLSFQMRRGYMTSNAQLQVQTSTDGGDTWITQQTYSGNGNGGVDGRFNLKQVSLPSEGLQTLIRFLFTTLTPNSGYSIADHGTAYPLGVFIDDVQVTNCDVLESAVPVSYTGDCSSVLLDATSAGGSLLVGNDYVLRLRARMGDHWFGYGEPLTVTPVTEASLSEYDAWVRSEYYFIGRFDEDYDQDGIPNGVERVFGMDPTDKSDGAAALRPSIVDGHIQLSHAIIPGGTVAAQLSYTLQSDSWQDVTVLIENGRASVSVPIGQQACYLRWKVSQ
ncbi:hypothetical protein HW115_07615 [Verrucomicrobiaceae bacterium N1E253]|uniref:SCP domain-containing protein n=1 Tax=Oceaniferula marina TaxID=2748318 RepID=A0A851GMY1_9BACT|nr:hypothetical protein [Oceaniferula marina]NWK55474.1 hypothetical protein [Oceaniferula marina]